LTINFALYALSLSLQGTGIRQEEHEKVFDRFYRSDKSRHTEGNGLGLSLVKAALALHKGKITFKDNDPGLIVEIKLKK
jgi:signal transduction histidine kinase